MSYNCDIAGTSKKWGDSYLEGACREPRSETVLGGKDVAKDMRNVNKARSQENDHDYGFSPARTNGQKQMDHNTKVNTTCSSGSNHLYSSTKKLLTLINIDTNYKLLL